MITRKPNLQVDADPFRPSAVSLRKALRCLVSRPYWNWKSALLSSACRGIVFFLANLGAGLEAAKGAMMAEFVYRSIAGGFYGSITQALRNVEPRVRGTLAAVILLPVISHSLEFAVHWLRGTPRLRTSILASVVFTTATTLFNLYAMRRGVLVVGAGGGSLASDLRRMPELIAGFFTAGVRWAWRARKHISL